ncbi:GAF and ANTAR domain-containing protein [Amycolatopsis halotolerans]|uniref:GAF and ANTAR domain-containing protein n=1 Tax=Amycolatopsis halotolerans TaxID=330083 RepID=A0ABV7QCS5_9PSEU
MARSGDAFDPIPRLLSETLAAMRESSDAVSTVKRLCEACVSLLPADGASVSIMQDTGHRQQVYASDAVVERIEDLQFSLGEGPCFEAFTTGMPVLVPDLPKHVSLSWPVFAAQIDDHQVGAVFAFPLWRGAARIGAMDLYRRMPGWLAETEVALALQIADIATSVLLAAAAPGPDGEISEAWITDLTQDRLAVHQATGIVIAAFGLSPEQALARLRGYAFATGQRLQDVADDLVTGRLHLREIDT